jgi:hypothetical protein
MADGLIRTLKTLLDEGSIPVSAVSTKQREKLSSLLDADIIVRERAGAGERFVAHNPEVIRTFAEQHYPNGLEAAEQADAQATNGTLTTADGVQNFRDAKRGGQTSEILTFRGPPGATLQVNGTTIPVGDETEERGVTSVLLTPDAEITFAGTLAVVENLTAFLRYEEFYAPADLALYGGGRLSQRVIDWLADTVHDDARVMLCPDYDFVGLHEFVRLERACGRYAEILIPMDFEDYFCRYAKHELFENGIRYRPAIRNHDDPFLKILYDMIHLHSAGLEQEALLKGSPFGSS